MSIRVLQVMAASAGGIARHVGLVTDALDRRGDMVVDIAGVRPPIPLPKDVIEVGIPTGLIGHRRTRKHLGKLIDEGGYDVVHAHGLRAAVDSAIAARSRIPVVATVHNLVRPDVSGRLKAIVYQRAETLTVKLCNLVFAVSQEIADQLERRSPRDSSRIEVLYLGIAEPPRSSRTSLEIRQELGVTAGPLIVTASRLSPQKALPVMLQAVARLEEPAVLAIAGTGPDERPLKELARALGLEDRVRWLGFRDDVHDVIAAADAFCLSSTWEGIPLAAQEAMQLGTPVVATRVGGLPELIHDGESGRLVDPGDSEALASALTDVIRSDALRAHYAQAARRRLEERFSTSKMLARLEGTYRELARAR